MLFLLILYYRKPINYDLSYCLHASVNELRHICISKRWGSKIPLMKAAKANINPRPAGGGGKGPPCGFSQIAPEVLGISL